MSEMRRWLDSLRLGQYADAFEENEIDFEVLPHLDHEVLKDIGVKAAGHRVRILTAARSLRSGQALDEREAGEPPSPSSEHAASKEAERRQLTVMFCDLAGSTALAERMDAEEYREVIIAYQEACARAVQRYEGYVARLFGDGMLTYFGYPRAHENDAERAIHAGLEILREMDALREEQRRTRNIELLVRIGIATGPVVVGDILGEGASQESTVLGETPNLAARLQALARPNRIVVSPATRRLAGGAFEYEDLGPQALKGIERPVNAWMVLGEADRGSRFEAARGERLTPLIGRNEELDLLLRRWRRAADGRGQVVLVSGEAGIGKSRLAQGLRERLADEAYTPLSYQCSPYHVSSALYPLINQLERAAGFVPGDAPESRLDKLESLLAQSTERVEHAARLLAALLTLPGEQRYGAVDLTPAQQKDQTLAVLLEQLEGLASRQPVLLLFEDVHWVDPTTLELLDLLVERAAGMRVLAVLTHRPDFRPAWSGESHVTSISLNKLIAENCAKLVSAVTGNRMLPDAVLDDIIEKTDGVPLFVEELTKTVIESGMLRSESGRYVLDQPLPTLSIPATLQDSLMARLDRLASVKDIAQIGAVIGREFGHELLEAVAGMSPSALNDGLNKLAEAGLVFRRGTPPQASYMFKHALVQDTAYASLLKSRRQQLHAKIASVLESQFQTLIASQPEIAAHHLHQAGFPERAIDYWRRAAGQASARSAIREAYNHLGAALAAHRELPRNDENQRLRLDLLAERIGPVIGVAGYSAPEMTELYEDAMSVYETLSGETPQIFAIMYAQWAVEYVGGRMTRALDRGREFLAAAERQGDRLAMMMGHRLCGVPMIMSGDPIEGCRHLEEVFDELDESLSDGIGFAYGQDTLTASNTYYAFGLCALGKFEQARERIELVLERAASLEHALTSAYANGHMGLLLAELGDSTGRDRCTASLESILAEHPMPFWNAMLTLLHGVTALDEGHHLRAGRLLEEGMTMAEQRGLGLWRPIFEGGLARNFLALGRFELASEWLSAAFASIERGHDSWIEPELHRLHGALLTARGRPDTEIEGCFRTALTRARAYPNRLYELRAALDLAGHWEAAGRVSQSIELLASVRDSIPEPHDIRELRETESMLSALGGNQGHS